MKKIGLLLVLCLAIGTLAQLAAAAADQNAPDGTVATNVNFPVERIEAPTYSDLYCAGFVSKNLLPNVNFVAGGLDTPNTTQYGNGELVYLTGKGYELGKRYSIVRELRDPNRYETYPGQLAMLKTMGQPYAELGTIRVVDTRSRSAVAKIEFSCAPIVPGDVVTPFVERASIPYHQPMHFDRFVSAGGKASGRIVLAKDFDTELGTGTKIYLNLGANQGIKPGDYFRAVRSYEVDLHDPVDSLSFKASAAEDTQAKPPAIEKNMFTGTKGPSIHVADLPRRAVGEIVILSTTPTTSTGMIVFAMEDMHIGDVVELDPQ
ncbi:MAG TPA: hypothetical protein VEG68_03705 [Terriglobales bacterium]|nr:hypothetical protein [Terriglobales bacterium]